MTVRELLSRIDSRELTEWQEYFKLEPFGEERADLRTAQVCRVIAEMYRSKDQRPYTLDDFLLKFGESLVSDDAEDTTPQPQLIESQKAMFQRIARDLGVTVKAK